MKKLFLLDAYALIYRAHYAFINNPRMNSQGLDTSAIYGFVNTLDDILNREKPTHIAVVFDPPTPTFRHELYPQYKAQRPPTPEAIKTAVPYIKQIIEAYNIPIYQVDGFEADDVIATYAVEAAKHDFIVFMMTPDKDYCQIVSDNIYLYKPARSGNEAEIMGVEEVKQKYKLENTSQFVDMLALMGDSSDNIPGATGIGEVTAQKLIAQFKSVENLLDKTKELKGKLKEKIENSIDNIRLSKVLATINTQVPVNFDENEMLIDNANTEKLIELFETLEFRNILNRLSKKTNQQTNTQSTQSTQPTLFSFEDTNTTTENTIETNYSTVKTIEHEYILIDTIEKRKELIELLSNANEFCFDTETTGIDAISAEIVGISFSNQAHKAWYVHLPTEKEQAKDILNEFAPLFENESILKIGQNIKYDLIILKNYDIKVKGKMFDTMLAHYLLKPEQKHNMDSMSEAYLKYRPISIEELIGKKGGRQLSMRQINPERICEYAAEDADVTYQLKLIFDALLRNENLIELFETIEMPLVRVLVEIEMSGVKIDKSALDNYAEELRNRISETEIDIKKDAGYDFNLSSPKQLGEILFDRMKISPSAKKTKTKQYSTNETELQKYINTHPIIKKILDFRGLQKLLNTYVETLPELINPQTGRIHTSYNQAVTSTGRLSSSNPNLQNIPIRTPEGRNIRASFIPQDDNHIIISADYSQIELRIMAHLSEDPNMIKAFENDEDIHTATAAKINGIDTQAVTKEMRANAKSANFGIIYGISTYGLAQNLNIANNEAKELIDGYFRTYPNVHKYMENIVLQARNNDCVKTIFGRKKELNDINSQNHIIKNIAERNAINAPIQGSAADIIKIAMIKIQQRIESENMNSRMIIQVHDELVFDALIDEKDKLMKIVSYEMSNATKLKVPLKVDIGFGKNWLEAH